MVTRKADRAASNVLIVVCTCTMLVVGFVAAINLAVPQLTASSLHPSSAAVLWIVDAYVVVFACLVIPAGAVGDRYGRKGALITGLLVLAVGAAMSAVAGDVGVLIVGRVVSGVGAALVLPNSLAVLVHAVDADRRGRAIAMWAAMTGVGGVIGNVGGGALLGLGSWRWLFVAVAPIALAAGALAAVTTSKTPRLDKPLDPLGAAVLTLATVALLLGIIEGPERGWGNEVVIAAFVAAVVLIVGWVALEIHQPHPMLDPRLFLRPELRSACLGMLVVFFGMFGLFYLNASLLQYGRGFSTVETGLAVIPLSIPLLAGARFVPQLYGRIGALSTTACAFAAISIGLFGLGSAVHFSYPVYAVWLVVTGVGVTLALPTLTAMITDAIPRNQAGIAGGLQSTTRELGSALGVAVIGTLLSSHFAHNMSGRNLDVDNQSIGAALNSNVTRHADVIDSYTASADTTLKTVAIIVACAGTAVVVEAIRARTAVRHDRSHV